MTTFFIVPFEPTEWETTSELLIDPEWYRERLLEKWPKTQLLDPTSDWHVLQWSICAKDWRGPISGLQKNLQIVSMSAPFIDFIVWHRNLIPSQYVLYLTSDSSEEYLQILEKTTKEEISRFLREKM